MNRRTFLQLLGLGPVAAKFPLSAVAKAAVVEGGFTRYMARTYAVGIAVSGEMLVDTKYDVVIAAAKRLRRASDDSAERAAVAMLERSL